MSRPQAVIGIDVGGTAIKGGLFGVDGTLLALESVASPSGGSEALLATVESQVKRFQELASSSELVVAGAGVLAPGIIDDERGEVLFAANLGWENLPLAARVSAATELPVTVGHDVRGASIAERVVGGARDAADFVLVCLGTGISCSLVLDGVTRVGVTGAAGELGHIPTVPNGELCSCGQRGCLEVYASAGGLARRYRDAGGDPDSTAQVVAARVPTEPLARAIWEDATSALSLALTSLVLLVDPTVILLAGGLSKAGRLLLDPTEAKLREHLQWRNAPEIRISPLGSEGGTVGGAILAMRAFGLEDHLAGWTPEIGIRASSWATTPDGAGAAAGLAGPRR